MAPKKDAFQSLWNKYFDDSLNWWKDKKNRKMAGRPPMFKHEVTREYLADKIIRKGVKGMLKEVRKERSLTMVGLLQDSAKQKDLHKGAKLHAYICERKFLEKNSLVASNLVSLYAECGPLAKAQQVLEALPVRDTSTWNALIAGYVQQGQGEGAVKCYDNMQNEGHSPDAVTFTCALKACGLMGAVAKGQQIHNKFVSLGMLEKDIVLGSTLVDMYAKCGTLPKAYTVLEELPVRDVISWNAIIAGYVKQDQGEEALNCYENMQLEGHSPDVFTFTCAFKACMSIGAVVKCEQIHDKIISLGVLEKDIMLGHVLFDMYVKWGVLENAKQVLREFPGQNLVMWNALLQAYCQQGQGEEVLKCYDSMQQAGHIPNAVTFFWALRACKSLGATAKGRQIYDKVISLGILEDNIELGHAFMDMYVLCSRLVNVQQGLLEEFQVESDDMELIAGHALQKGRKQ